MQFGIKPDIHIRKFGALAYVHIAITPGRHKYHKNAKFGYVLGYAEDTVGCKVYFLEEHIAKFVTESKKISFIDIAMILHQKWIT